MIEFLFLLGFTLALLFTGFNVLGIVAAFAVGFIVMAIAGMIGLVFKMLPWILLILVVVWVLRGKDKTAQKCREYYRSR